MRILTLLSAVTIQYEFTCGLSISRGWERVKVAVLGKTMSPLIESNPILECGITSLHPSRFVYA